MHRASKYSAYMKALVNRACTVVGVADPHPVIGPAELLMTAVCSQFPLLAIVAQTLHIAVAR